MMSFIKMALDVDFLLFLLGIFWTDIAIYIQKRLLIVIQSCSV